MPIGFQGDPRQGIAPSGCCGPVGKTWEPGAFEQLLADVSTRVFDDTTLGEQRPHLAEWRERGW